MQRFDEFFIGPNAVALYVSMWGAVGFVLLIACAMGRSREISVRIALGAGRWRIIRQVLIETVTLSSVGGFLAWWIAKWGVRAYAAALADKSSWLIVDYTLDHRVVAYLTAVSIGTGSLFGLTPALQLSNLNVNGAWKDARRGTTVGGRRKHLSAVLVAGEMALAVVLLAAAGVMIRSFLKIHNASMGVDTANVLVESVELPTAKYAGADQKIAFFDRLTSHLAAMSGVDSVATAENLPSLGAAGYPYEVPGAPPAEYDRGPKVGALKVGPDYFSTLRAALLAGRDFDGRDVASGVPVAIVNQMFAAKYWPGEDPLGKRLRLFDDNMPEAWRTVIGVVSNIVQRDQTRQRIDPLVYLPYRQKPGAGMRVLAWTRVPPARLATAFRHEVQALDSDLPLYGPFALAERLERYWDSRFYGALFLIFALIALLLASIGLYTSWRTQSASAPRSLEFG